MKFTNRQHFLSCVNELVRTGWDITEIKYVSDIAAMVMTFKNISTQLYYKIEYHQNPEAFANSPLKEYKRERTFTVPERFER